MQTQPQFILFISCDLPGFNIFIFSTTNILFCIFSLFKDLEWYMVSHKIITDSELEEDPRSAGSERKQVNRAGAFHNHMAADSDDDFDT